MKKHPLKQAWLNLILHLSSGVYKLKNQLFFSGTIKTILIASCILILEIILAIVSLPLYFFVVPNDENLSFGEDADNYRLRRKLTLGIFFGFLIFQVVGTFLAMMGFGFFYNYLIYGWFF